MRDGASSSLRKRVALARRMSFEGRDTELVAALAELPPATGDDARLRHQALVLRARSLVRLGRFDAAIATYREAPLAAADADAAEARAHMLVGMAFACVHLANPERAVTLADAAFRLALAGDQTALASHALEVVGICRAMSGEPAEAEHFFLQALGLALQHGDDSFVQLRLSNLLFLAQTQVDACRAAGDSAGAAHALQQCGRFAAQGDRLARWVGVYERCLWRSNRAGWLRRRGLLAEAITEYADVRAQAERHGWIVLHRNASFDQTVAFAEQGRAADAIGALQRLTDVAPLADGHEIAMKAHGLLQSMLGARGDDAQAAQHARAFHALARRHEAGRVAAAAALSQVGAEMVAALAAADAVRLDAERERLRTRAIDASNEAFFSAGAPA